MRFLAALAFAATLGACDAHAPQGDAEAAVPAGLTGRYNASSDTARSLTGGVVISRDGMAFEKGAMLETHRVGLHHGWDLISRDGDTFAAAAVGPSDLSVELRRIRSSQSLRGAPNICGGRPPSYVAITYEAQRADVRLLVFTGDEPPGPEATRSTLCGAFGYAAPSGARTREGVVLY